MLLKNPRQALFTAVIFDSVGYALITALLLHNFYLSLDQMYLSGQALWLQSEWLVLNLLAYIFFSWLLGSYTLLRWHYLSISSLTRRIFSSAFLTVLTMAFARLLLNPPPFIFIAHRKFQIMLIIFLFIWSFTVRIVLIGRKLSTPHPELLILDSIENVNSIVDLWASSSSKFPLKIISFSALRNTLKMLDSAILIVPDSINVVRSIEQILQHNLNNRPGKIQCISPLELFQIYHERLPPTLLPDFWLTYSNSPYAQRFNTQIQLKRFFDISFSLILLLCSLPVVLLSALLIWNYDKGPIIYKQKRSGFLCERFYIYKLRTMKVEKDLNLPRWTQPDDSRITPIGKVLRRFRIDELPQLINVLNGSMSLIGPRPERPEHELELESSIPHYRKRHWIRPGLSGWAQVSYPYASSVHDTEIKLSYDLFYIKNFSLFLDIVIFMKTIKTVLKAGGR